MPSAVLNPLELPWPDVESTSRPGDSARRVLDYVVWICNEMSQPGFHGGSRGQEWRRRAQQAYRALFLPVVPGHGDPYPPDVPPPETPGLWPDVPAAAIPGMTVRHQLVVIGLQAEQLRAGTWFHARPNELVEWDRRLALVRAALDHGDTHPMPEEAETHPDPAVIAAVEANQQALAERDKRRQLQMRRDRDRRRREAKRAAAEAAKPKPDPKAAAPVKAAPEEAPATETVPEQAAPKKVAAKKSAPKKVAAKKAAAKKKAAPKKAAAKKAVAKKTASKKKAASKKKTAKTKKAATKR